ncbi:hypothetical protein F4775DRAFT_388067 [Biscogniauxia sp. FL1348]|nr:hypothetical protein F4775DRAFT_388067 [Biscogniauxia sp. FL1348]
MRSPAPNATPSDSFAARMDRAQDAIANAIVQEIINRGILTDFGIFDFTGMDSLTGTDVNAFREMISHHAKGEHLYSEDVLLSLCAILARANASWKEFTREKGPVNYKENKAVFWYMLWEKFYSKEGFSFINHGFLMKMVSYYTAGFQNLVKKTPVFHNPGSTQECLCICHMAEWLLATEGVKVRLSAEIEGMNYKNAPQALGRVEQGSEGEPKKSEPDWMALHDLINQGEDQETDSGEESTEEEEGGHSEHNLEILRLALKSILHSTSEKLQTAYLSQLKRLKVWGRLDATMTDHFKKCLEDEVASGTLTEDAKARCCELLQDWD